jgi:hypothetical protein
MVIQNTMDANTGILFEHPAFEKDLDQDGAI